MVSSAAPVRGSKRSSSAANTPRPDTVTDNEATSSMRSSTVSTAPSATISPCCSRVRPLARSTLTRTTASRQASTDPGSVGGGRSGYATTSADGSSGVGVGKGVDVGLARSAFGVRVGVGVGSEAW